MFIRAFYDDFYQVNSIFCFKNVIFTKKTPINSTVLSFLGASDKAIKLLSCSIFMTAFQSRSNRPHNISGSENIASPRFHAVSFVLK